MKHKHHTQRPQPADPLGLPPVVFPDKEKVFEKLLRNQEAVLSALEQGGGEIRYAVPENVIKAMAVIATNAWKAKARMLDPASGEVRDDMKRVYRHIEAIFQAFGDMGLEIKDHTGDPFDYGLPLHVVTTQPTPGLTTERVLETIKPTIYWQRQVLQRGEVVIATPA
jgi:hypothetical protein